MSRLGYRLPDPCGRCGHPAEWHAGDKDCLCGSCMWMPTHDDIRALIRARADREASA